MYVDQLRQREIVQHAQAGERRPIDADRGPVRREPPPAGLGVGHQPHLPLLERLDQLPLQLGVLAFDFRPLRGTQQPIHDAHAAGRVQHVDRRRLVAGGDPDRRVLGAGRRAADQQRLPEALAAASPSPRAPSRPGWA